MTEPGTRVRRLNPKSTQVVALIATGRTVDEVMQETGLSRRTVQRLKVRLEPEIQSARAEVLTSALGVLTSALTEASRTLADLLAPGTPEAVRIRAATALFDAHARINESLHIDQRIAALEEAIAARGDLRIPRSFTHRRRSPFQGARFVPPPAAQGDPA